MTSQGSGPTRLEPLFELSKSRGDRGGLWALGLCFLAAAGLSAEVLLQIYKGKSVCPNEVCALVGEYVLIGERGLMTIGAAFFWILFGLIFFSRRYPRPWLKALPQIALLGALSFDGLLMGFQVFKIQKLCLICLATALVLIAIHLVYSFGLKSFAVAVAGLAVWAGAFAGNGLLKMPQGPKAPVNFVFYSLRATNGPEFPRLTLIFSLHCPHCLKVIERLSEIPPGSLNIRLATVDTDAEALEKLSFFLKEAPKSDQPLSLLLKFKRSASSEKRAIPAGLVAAAQAARKFLFAQGLYGIPVLMVEEGPDRRLILSGEEAIMTYLQQIFTPQGSNQEGR